MTFIVRKIRLTFILGTGSFGETGRNTVTVEGLRVQAHIIKTGATAMGEAQLRIHGLTPTLLNALTSIYTVTQLQRRNTIIVEAGDDVVGVRKVFEGGITVAQADLNQQPDSVLNIIAHAGLIFCVQPKSEGVDAFIGYTSYPAPATVDTILSAMAPQMGLRFENNGVDKTLDTPYFKGAIREQVLAVIAAASCEWNNGDDGVLAIWPKGGHRAKIVDVPIISPETGMIGYPAYSNLGLMVRTLFNPNIVFGGQIEVKSSIPQANYRWNVYGLSYQLESETPGGAWLTEIHGFSVDAVTGTSPVTVPK